MKSKKLRSAERVSQFESILQCPICEGSMSVVDFNSLRCIKNHTFDFSKQGYVNLLAKPSNRQYEKQLFEARQKMIVDRNMYRLLHQEMKRLITKHADVSAKPFMILDLGCGEGSHLHNVLGECNVATMFGIGIDISKDGIAMAAKSYDTAAWFVSDLADLPFAPQSFHVVLNILSPIHYEECKRILAEDGMVVKVVPGSDYLKELREVLYAKSEKRFYKNEKTVQLFKKHFCLTDNVHVYTRKKLNRHELKDLIRMTPLAWSANQEQKDAFLNQEIGEITIDLHILVGRKQIKGLNHS